MWTSKQSKKFQTPNYSKEFLRKPVILKSLGDVKGKKIVEFGCGSGYWTRLLAKRGAKCTGIELSSEQFSLAIQEEKEHPLGITYLQQDISRTIALKSNSFDIVFIEYVLLEINSQKALDAIFRQAHRLLKKGGIIFVSEMHPFDPLIQNTRFTLPESFHYFQSGAKMMVYATQVDGTKISFTDYHWTLEDYIGAMTRAGFSITSIKEPRPSEELIRKVPYLKYRETLPKDIIIIGKKI